MTIFMYQVVTNVTRAIVQATHYNEFHSHFFGLGEVARSRYDNLIKMIMEELLVSGGLPWDQIA